PTIWAPSSKSPPLPRRRQSVAKGARKGGAPRPRVRRPLATVRAAAHLPLESVGEPAEVAKLERIVTVPASADVRRLTHGFHAYPAKLHPLWAKRAITAYGIKGA